jgi:predicted aspartyl protease
MMPRLVTIYVVLVLVLFVVREASSQTDPPESGFAAAETETGIRLFMAPDDSSPVVANLDKGEEISPLADTLVGKGVRWYLVKTKEGTVGWVRSSATDESKKLEKSFKTLPAEAGLPISVDVAPAASGISARNTITVAVEMNGSWIIVPVTFNGTIKAYLQLDTGASSTLVSRRIANSLALTPLGVRRGVTVSGPITLPVARVGSLNVGGAEIRDLVVAIHEFSPDARIEGLLGLDFLKNFHVSLDARRKLLILAPR